MQDAGCRTQDAGEGQRQGGGCISGSEVQGRVSMHAESGLIEKVGVSEGLGWIQ